jgi:hypothetical protein
VEDLCTREKADTPPDCPCRHSAYSGQAWVASGPYHIWTLLLTADGPENKGTLATALCHPLAGPGPGEEEVSPCP